MAPHEEGDSTSPLTAEERLETEVLTRHWGVVLGRIYCCCFLSAVQNLTKYYSGVCTAILTAVLFRSLRRRPGRHRSEC